MLLLTASAFAVETGDITVKFNPAPLGDGKVWYGTENVVEIWMTNSSDVMGLSLGFAFTSSVPLFSWKTPYGNKPSGAKYVQEWGDFTGGMDNALKFTATSLPGMFLIGGAATPVIPDGGYPIPPHAASTKAWDLRLIMPPATEPQTFSVKPVFFPPAGAWKIDYGTVLGWIMPTFNGYPTGTVPSNPFLVDDPPYVVDGAVVVETGPKPCGLPEYSNVPGVAPTSSHAGFEFPFAANYGEVAPLSWDAVGGSITSAGVLTVPGQCPALGTTAVTVMAINGCPLPNNHADYPFTITWTNALPLIDCAAIGTPIATIGSMKAIPIGVTDADPGDAASLVWNAITDAPAGSYTFVGNELQFTPATTGTYHFTITATDMCLGVSAPCIFTVEAVAYDIVQIPKLGDGGDFVFQGTYTHVPVILSGSALSLAGYNLLIYYDASALSFVSAEIGDQLKPCDKQGLGWEYFTYRFGADGNCGGPCPSGLLRLVALAETNNGANHPGCGGDPFDAYGEIADLKFYVTNDRTYECQFTAIGFAWIDCSDNTFSDPTGNILYAAGDYAVHTFEWDGLTLDSVDILCEPYPNMTGVIYGGFCVPDCEVDDNKPIEEKLFFWNGGIDIACANEIDARGDINLNGVSNEIADAVLFTNFFIKGITAFYDDPYSATRVQGKVAATDVNADGHPLTVGDLVYLLRIIVGDAQPIQKLSPFASAATVNFVNGSVSTVSGSEIGAVYATFAINGAYNVVSNTNMQVESGEVNGELKVLVYSGMTNLSNRIASGTSELFTVSGDVELKSVEVADNYGNMLNARVNKISLPTSFALSQNVPNPFNPTTKLGFALPNQTEWTLSIYNVAGQLVKNFSGNNIGNVSVEWDASMAPSGVYFYKLNAGSYSDTKKMVLMK
jgi:hypothetical protein